MRGAAGLVLFQRNISLPIKGRDAHSTRATGQIPDHDLKIPAKGFKQIPGALGMGHDMQFDIDGGLIGKTVNRDQRQLTGVRGNIQPLEQDIAKFGQ